MSTVKEEDKKKRNQARYFPYQGNSCQLISTEHNMHACEMRTIGCLRLTSTFDNFIISRHIREHCHIPAGVLWQQIKLSKSNGNLQSAVHGGLGNGQLTISLYKLFGYVPHQCTSST